VERVALSWASLAARALPRGAIARDRFFNGAWSVHSGYLGAEHHPHSHGQSRSLWAP
jgi:hypothetical protein